MLKSRTGFFCVLTAVILFISSVNAREIFTGIWCLEREKLIISFDSESTLTVTNIQEESITENHGKYEKTDSSFTAIIESDDLSIRMGYKYKWEDKSELEAKILYITVDGDSIDHPKRWLDMERCDPGEYFGKTVWPDSSGAKKVDAEDKTDEAEAEDKAEDKD